MSTDPAGRLGRLGRPAAGAGEVYLAEFSLALADYLRLDCGFTAADTRRVALRLLCVTEPRPADRVPRPGFATET